MAGAQRRDVAMRFLIAWAVPFWILVELVPTKLPQYLLPVYPALALAAGAALLASDGKWRRYDLLFGAIGVLVALCLMALLVEAPIRYGGGLEYLSASPPRVGLAVFAVLLIVRRQTTLRAARSRSVAASWCSSRSASSSRRASTSCSCRARRRRWSRQARRGGRLQRAEHRVLARHRDEIAAGATSRRRAGASRGRRPCWSSGARSRRFATRMTRLGATPRAAGMASGLDYSNGKPATLTLFSAE